MMTKYLLTNPRFALAAIALSGFCFAGLVQAVEEPVTESDKAEESPSPKKEGEMKTDDATQKETEPKKEAHKKKADTKKEDAPKTEKETTRPVSLSMKDERFMQNAARDGTMEVHMGELAAKQGKSADVKKMGKRIAADHKKANKALMALASKKGVTLNTDHKMARIDDANFDKQWLAAMVKDHEKDIKAFEKEAQKGDDADVKAFATKTLPTLKEHLAMVKETQGKLK